MCVLVSVALTAVCGSVWLSCLLVGEVGVEVEVEVEGLQWPSLPALGRRQGQGGGSSAGLSTHERMLCGWVRTTANTSHTHTYSMHAARQACYTVSAMQLESTQQTVLEVSYTSVNGTFFSNNLVTSRMETSAVEQ